MKTTTKISAVFLLFILVQTQAQETGHEGASSGSAQPNQELSYWEREFQQNAQKFYHHFEAFFVDFVVPGYQLVKESALLTTIAVLILTIYFTKQFLGLFKGEGTKKFKYNKEEPISYADLNQHFKNFTKELDELKKQVKNGPEGGSAGGDSQGVSAGTVNVPELDKLSKSLGKTEEHLTKLYQENKQLNSFLASFQKEILESHKEIWKELHSLKTTRPAASGARTGRPQSVSAEDRIPRRLQDSAPTKPLETTTKPKETLSKTSDAGFSKSTTSNGPGADARSHPVSNDSSVRQSQEIKTSQPQEQQPVTESSNPFQSPTEKPEQKPTPGPSFGAGVTARIPGRGPIQNRPMGGPGGAFKQPPFGATPDQQKTTVSQPPEQKEELQKQTPIVETNVSGGLELPTNTTDLSTKTNTEPSVAEEEKSVTSEQTNPEQSSVQNPGFGGGVGGPFQGLPAKKPTPVVRNNFAVPGKRVTPVPNNAIKKTPPMMNPGANFVPNPDGGAGGSNI